MQSLDLIPPGDFDACLRYAQFLSMDIEETVSAFIDDYVGEWPTTRDFARDRVMWEHGLPQGLMPFFNIYTYIDTTFGVDGCFVALTKEDGSGVYIFQVADEPDWWTNNA